jgi:hypothetical protein
MSCRVSRYGSTKDPAAPTGLIELGKRERSASWSGWQKALCRQRRRAELAAASGVETCCRSPVIGARVFRVTEGQRRSRDMRNAQMDEKRSLWNRIVGLPEEDLAQRRSARAVVRVPSGSSSSRNR